MVFIKGHKNAALNRSKAGVKSLTSLLALKLDDPKEVVVEGTLVSVTANRRVALKGDKVKIRLKLANREAIVNAILAMAADGDIRAISEIWDRVEGKSVQKVDVNAKVEMEANVNVNMSNAIVELTRLIPINMIVAALVAAKRGIDPMKLMSEVGNSYYSKYSGFSNTKLEKGELPIDISTIQYDWEKIKRIHKYEDGAGKELESTMTQDDKTKLLKMLKNK